MSRGSRFLLLLAGASIVLGASAHGAFAADTYVNAGAGDDSNDCLSAGQACETIAGPMGAVAKATAGATVHVAPGTYPEAVQLPDGKSLVASGSVDATIIAPAAGTAVTVPSGSSGGTIAGLTLRSAASSSPTVVLQGSASVRNSVLDSDVNDYVAQLDIGDAAGGSVARGNSFSDPVSDGQYAIETTASSATISRNVVDGYNQALYVHDPTAPGDATATFSRNEITGTHVIPGGAAAIYAVDAHATISRNLIHEPGSGSPEGVMIWDTSNDGPAGATLTRNRIADHVTGVRVLDTASPVTLDSDLITGASYGIYASDSDLAPGEGNVIATNVTIDGGFDVRLQDATLTLDSGILAGSGVLEQGSAGCTIAFSRGPAGSGDCGTFQTNADPKFKDPFAGNYHLKKSSPMIDRGNPAAPPPGSKDIDGDKRALDGPDGSGCEGAKRRDIGTDEYRC